MAAKEKSWSVTYRRGWREVHRGKVQFETQPFNYATRPHYIDESWSLCWISGLVGEAKWRYSRRIGKHPTILGGRDWLPWMSVIVLRFPNDSIMPRSSNSKDIPRLWRPRSGRSGFFDKFARPVFLVRANPVFVGTRYKHLEYTTTRDDGRW